MHAIKYLGFFWENDKNVYIVLSSKDENREEVGELGRSEGSYNFSLHVQLMSIKFCGL